MHLKSDINSVPRLRLVAWELTRSCILSCIHCRACASVKKFDEEFSTSECMKVIDSLATAGNSIVILTGGEPMLRKDIYDIARYGTDKGLRMVMATCGALLDENKCRALIDAGISRISLSLDGATEKSHDSFRGVKGAFDSLMKGIQAAKKAGLEFQINTTITKSNLHELPAIYSHAVELKAVSFHPFLLVPAGRAKELTGEMISAVEYERTLNWIYEKHISSEISVKPTCAPHYYRIFRKREQLAGREVKPQTHGLDAYTKGCLGGQSFAFISHIGIVQICGFLDLAAGDLRASQYNFDHIWRTSPLFNQIRKVNEYHGKCGYCDYNNVCGGCRARAYTINDDFLGEEPQCLYTPEISNNI